MTISITIPAYNAARTVAATVQSALSQTIKPFEILVVDDGSTDDTAHILGTFGDKIRVIRQENRGVASARNTLCREAQGDLIAFLDADDLWHPSHLATHLPLVRQYPAAVAFFSYHYNFTGYGDFSWPKAPLHEPTQSECISPKDFVTRCNAAPMHFQLSCGSVPRNVLRGFGRDPFRYSGAEDTFLHHLLALAGPVVHTSARTVAYRINPSSLSADRKKIEAQVVRGLSELAPEYAKASDPSLLAAFLSSFAARRRLYGRFLMGSGETSEARREFLRAARACTRVPSRIKSFALFLSTYLPKKAQPSWRFAPRSTSD
jgi:glycosyltransferase involved in cell wall biosynthesis